MWGRHHKENAFAKVEEASDCRCAEAQILRAEGQGHRALLILMRLMNRLSRTGVAERKWRQGGLSNGWE